MADNAGLEIAMYRAWNRLRFRVGSWIIGDDWYRVISNLWLIRDRARAAVSRDGLVTLAACPALAEVLYEQVPGNWELSIRHVVPSSPSSPSER